MAEDYYGTGGFQPKGLGGVLQGSGTGGAYIMVRYVGADPLHGMGPGKLPTGGCKVDNGDTTKETGGGGLVIPTTGGSDELGKILGHRVLYLKEAEHVHAVQCN